MSHLNKIMSVLKPIIAEADEEFKVRCEYGEGKFYLNKISGDYDSSLQNLIHHVLWNEGVYKEILNGMEYAICKVTIEEEPNGIFWPNEDDENCCTFEELHYDIMQASIQYMAERGYVIDDEMDEYIFEEDEI